MARKKSTHVDDPVAAGRRVKEARERAGVSQRQLAFPGCSPAYISRIEAGERIASPQVLRELARRLDVSEDYLARGVQTPPSSMFDDAEIALRLDRVDESARLFETALEDARTTQERSRALEGLGQVAFRRGDPDGAVELLERALSLAETDVSDRPALADSLARAYASLGQLAQSIAILERCAEAFKDEPVQYVRFAGLLGNALTDNGSFAEAERVLADALSRGRDVADPYTRARLYWSESRLRTEQGQSALAADYAQRTLAILRTTEDNYAIAHVLQSLAHIYVDLDRPGDALELLREGHGLISAAGTPLEIAQYRIEEARALAALGENDEAAKLAMAVTNDLQGAHRVDTGRSFVLLAHVFSVLGDNARAIELLELGVEMLEEQRPSRYRVQAYNQLSELLKQRGDTDGALQVLERAISVQESVGRPLA